MNLSTSYGIRVHGTRVLENFYLFFNILVRYNSIVQKLSFKLKLVF